MPGNTSAFHLLLTGNPALFSIVGLSLAISLTASVVASFIGMPLGALVALNRLRGREFVIVGMNALVATIIGGAPEGPRKSLVTRRRPPPHIAPMQQQIGRRQHEHR
jgi:hypothetical protein